MRRTYFFLFALFATYIVQAQILKVNSGTNLTITTSTVFTVDSLTLIPSANFTLSDVTLSKSTSVNNSSANPYIKRVYQFSNASNPFSGSVLISYTDGAELNGINEASLTLNIHNGTNWAAYNATTRDGSNNFVFTNGISGINLNELTLASQFSPLPLGWLSYTAIKQNQTALLEWGTAWEQNTKSFFVEHSTDGINWITIGFLPAAGNSSNTITYNYLHTNPETGVNYYRIKQTDIDNRYSYSQVRTVLFTSILQPFSILGNPVTNGLLTVQVNTATSLSLFTADGKLLWQQKLNNGQHTIDVSRYANGTYFLKSGNNTQKVVIQ